MGVLPAETAGDAVGVLPAAVVTDVLMGVLAASDRAGGSTDLTGVAANGDASAAAAASEAAGFEAATPGDAPTAVTGEMAMGALMGVAAADTAGDA